MKALTKEEFDRRQKFVEKLVRTFDLIENVYSERPEPVEFMKPWLDEIRQNFIDMFVDISIFHNEDRVLEVLYKSCDAGTRAEALLDGGAI